MIYYDEYYDDIMSFSIRFYQGTPYNVSGINYLIVFTLRKKGNNNAIKYNAN